MLDIERIRKHPDEVRAGLEARGAPPTLVDDFLELDEAWRGVRFRIDEMRARQKSASKEIGALFKEGKKEEAEARKAEAAGLSDDIATAEEERRALEERRRELLLEFPNPCHEAVPVGPDETSNRVERTWGEPRSYDFEPKAHWDLGAELGILDLPTAARLAGSRFPMLRGAGARLERALASFMMDLQTREHGYTEISPPYMANADTLTGTGQLPKFEEDLFKVEPGGWYLIPTAEVPLTSIPAGEILAADDLPMRFAALTPCFRSEAGAHGRDTRGIMRVHQFLKVELVWITRPEESWDALEELTRHAEEVVKRLELPYRVSTLSTGDVSFASARTYDVEVWLAGQQSWREVSSCSNCTDFQARRAGIRYRPEPGAPPLHAHTLNGSGIALPRTWVAIVEHYQRADGGVDIPEVLRPYMDGLEAILPAQAG